MENVRVVRLHSIGDQVLIVVSKDWLYVTEDKDKLILSKKPTKTSSTN